LIHNNRAKQRAAKKLKWSKQNMTRQLRARLSWLKDDLKREKAGLKQALYYCKLLKKRPSISTSVKAWKNGILKTKRDLANLTSLIKRRQRNGQSYKIL